MKVTKKALKEALKKACNYQHYLTEEEYNKLTADKAQDHLIERLIKGLETKKI